MSQLASFYVLPSKALEWDLIQAARPRKRLFRKPLYVFSEYLEREGKELSIIDGDGTWWLLILTYLAMFENVDLCSGDKDIEIMTGILSKHQGGAFTILSHMDKEEYLDKIKSMEIDRNKVAELLVAEGIASPEKALSHVYSDRRSWEHAKNKLVEVLDLIAPDQIILTSVA